MKHILYATALLASFSVFGDLQPVAIGENTYDSLEAALAQAVDGDTLTLIQDIELTNGVTFASADASRLTLDLGGHTLSYPTASSTEYMITVSPTNSLVVTNGTLTTTGRGAWVSGSLTIAADTSLTADCRALNIVGVDDNIIRISVLLLRGGLPFAYA